MSVAALDALQQVALLQREGFATSAEVVWAAAEALAAGAEGPALGHLAGVADATRDEVEAALAEHGRTLPPPEAPAGQGAALVAVARAVVAGRVPPREAAAWAHRAVGHDGVPRAAALVELDDRYGTDVEDPAALDAEVLSVCEGLAVVRPTPDEAALGLADGLRDEELPLLAARWLAEGWDGEGLVRLAGASRTEARQDGRRLLREALHGLDLPLQQPGRAVRWAARLAWAVYAMDVSFTPVAAAAKVLEAAEDDPSLLAGITGLDELRDAVAEAGAAGPPVAQDQVRSLLQRLLREAPLTVASAPTLAPEPAPEPALFGASLVEVRALARHNAEWVREEVERIAGAPAVVLVAVPRRTTLLVHGPVDAAPVHQQLDLRLASVRVRAVPKAQLPRDDEPAEAVLQRLRPPEWDEG